MGEVGVESEHVIAGGLGKAGFERAGIAAAALGDHSRAERLRGLAGAVGRVAIDNDDLIGKLLALHACLDAWEQDEQVIAFVENGEDYRNIHNYFARESTHLLGTAQHWNGWKRATWICLCSHEGL